VRICNTLIFYNDSDAETVCLQIFAYHHHHHPHHHHPRRRLVIVIIIIIIDVTGAWLGARTEFWLTCFVVLYFICSLAILLCLVLFVFETKIALTNGLLRHRFLYDMARNMFPN